MPFASSPILPMRIARWLSLTRTKTGRQKPDFAAAHASRGLALLLTGDFTRGWAEYEWRWHCPEFAAQRFGGPQPAWDGGPLEGRTILLRAEQGLGDTLQFFRYVPLVR